MEGIGDVAVYDTADGGRSAVAGVRPAMMRIVVDFPAPLGPRKPVTRPGFEVNDTSSSAT